MNANNSYCGPAESLWMKSDIVLNAHVVRVVWLQSYAFQEVSSQERFLFKPSAIHEPHFWNEPTKLSQPHSFNKTPTTVCPGSNSMHSSSGFVHDATTQQGFEMITQQDNSSLSLSNKLRKQYWISIYIEFDSRPLNCSPHLCFCQWLKTSGFVLVNDCFLVGVFVSGLVFPLCIVYAQIKIES